MKPIFSVTLFVCIGIAVSVAIPMSKRAPVPDLDDPACTVCITAGEFIEQYKNFYGDSTEEAKRHKNFVCQLFLKNELMEICMRSYNEEVDYIYRVTDLRTVSEICIDMSKCKAKENI
ncbi:uncharacterized protein [Diabrotica undecimpunctata]|uniref:uncharacterized protein isoform X2 n=1 Tax=Diabrotica undecimpunctata TaxID=50387 RepID=UPI003B63402D